MPYADYAEVQTLRDQARRRDALARLEQLRTHVQARGTLSPAQAENLANQVSNAV